MPNRILKEGICTSEDIDSLTASEEVFFYRLIVNCDDYGRFDARESILKSRLYPLKQLKSNEITCNLLKLLSLGMILLYKNNGQPYIQMVSWEKHQQIRNHRSKYPAFNDENSIEINYNQLKSDVTVIQSNPIRIRNPIREPKTAEKITTDVKTAYADNVLLTEKDYNTLVEKYGIEFAKTCIEKLDAYKLSSGKTYKSDYGAINSWVVDKVKEKVKPKNDKPIKPADKILRIPEGEKCS